MTTTLNDEAAKDTEELTRIRALVRHGIDGREDHHGPRLLRRLAEGRQGGPYGHFSVRPHGPLLGAQIEGLNLSEPLAPEVFEELDRALLEWKVLFFRGQELTHEQQRAFAANWGEIDQHPFLPKGASRTSSAWRRALPTPASRTSGTTTPLDPQPAARRGPADGGDARGRGRHALRRHRRGLRQPARRGEEAPGGPAGGARLHTVGELPRPADGRAAPALPGVVPAGRPSGGADPPRGQDHKSLFVTSIFTTHIEGLEPAESEELLRYLFRHVQYPEYQVRFRWQPGDVVFWDNRAVQHYATSDYYPHRRVVDRAAIAGDRPF